MTLEEKFSRIVDTLIQKTEQGEIHWEPSTGESFATSRPDSSIVVEEDDYRYRISLYDGQGRRLETMLDKELPGGAEKLYQLFTVARRTALDVESVADTWLA